MSANKLNWTTDWPKKVGRYWFYGQRYRNAAKAELFTVVVMTNGAGYPVYVCEGQFLYQAEGAVGLWAPLPDPVNTPYKEYLELLAKNLNTEK